VEVEAEAPEAAIFYGSGSGKHKMNGRESGRKNIGSKSDKKLPLSPLPLLWYLMQDFFILGKLNPI